jgi:hypothetical protein
LLTECLSNIRKAKINQVKLPVAIYQYIARVKIAMIDPVFQVQLFQAVNNISRYLHGLLLLLKNYKKPGIKDFLINQTFIRWVKS